MRRTPLALIRYLELELLNCYRNGLFAEQKTEDHAAAAYETSGRVKAFDGLMRVLKQSGNTKAGRDSRACSQPARVAIQLPSE